MAREVKLKPGWLAEELRHAPADYAMAFSPSRLAAAGADRTKMPVGEPLEGEDARLLREKLCARYKEWTGRCLAHDLVTDAALAHRARLDDDGA